jgi:hypothetical protein
MIVAAYDVILSDPVAYALEPVSIELNLLPTDVVAL